jgi:hypothetical protein
MALNGRLGWGESSAMDGGKDCGKDGGNGATAFRQWGAVCEAAWVLAWPNGKSSGVRNFGFFA